MLQQYTFLTIDRPRLKIIFAEGDGGFIKFIFFKNEKWSFFSHCSVKSGSFQDGHITSYEYSTVHIQIIPDKTGWYTKRIRPF